MKGVGVLSTSRSCAGKMGTYVKLQPKKSITAASQALLSSQAPSSTPADNPLSRGCGVTMSPGRKAFSWRSQPFKQYVPYSCTRFLKACGH